MIHLDRAQIACRMRLNDGPCSPPTEPQPPRSPSSATLPRARRGDRLTLTVLCILGVALGALAQASTGMGFALVAAPALIATLGPREGVSTVLLLGVLASAIPLGRDWRHANPKDVLRLLVPALVFTPLIALALRGVDVRWLALTAGCGVIVSAALLASGLRSRWLMTPVGAIATGLSSAALTVVGGVGGPPFGLYAANAGWSPRQVRGTLLSILFVQGIATVLILGFALPSWPLVLALAAGGAAGMVTASRIPPSAARAAILLISVAGGIALIIDALRGG